MPARQRMQSTLPAQQVSTNSRNRRFAMEAEFIAWLQERIPPHRYLRLGPGDDAALVSQPGSNTIVTVDMISEGVDFDLRTTAPARVGRKALAVNLSDIAAMAARPTAAVVALSLPKANALPLAKRLYEGLLPLAEQFDTPIAGGDLQTWDGPLVISITVLGQPGPRGPLLRSGARPGDAIVVTGSLGGSILGKHLDFLPRIEEAALLHEKYELHAGMDMSDGLSLDLWRMCQASGCGAAIDFDLIPVSEAARQLSDQRQDGITPLVHALGDGEDFELLLAVPWEEAQRLCQDQPLNVPVTMIGRFVEQPGLWQQSADGMRPMVPFGYEH